MDKNPKPSDPQKARAPTHHPAHRPVPVGTPDITPDPVIPSNDTDSSGRSPPRSDDDRESFRLT